MLNAQTIELFYFENTKMLTGSAKKIEKAIIIKDQSFDM